jgi:hypothetical protein
MRTVAAFTALTLAPLSTRTPCMRSQMRRPSRSYSGAVQARPNIERNEVTTPRVNPERGAVGARPMRYFAGWYSASESQLKPWAVDDVHASEA